MPSTTLVNIAQAVRALGFGVAELLRDVLLTKCSAHVLERKVGKPSKVWNKVNV